jgi:pyruvate/2-oxoglutarate dehydrogenase complex dihydrolipoamide dehydrogenase (E3) component
VQKIGAADKVTGLRLADGDVVAADAVVIGVGILPNIELAAAAGLPTDNGVVVDEHLATIDPDVFAAGDVANAYYPLIASRERILTCHASITRGFSRGVQPGYAQFWLDERVESGRQSLGSCVGFSTGRRGMVE